MMFESLLSLTVWWWVCDCEPYCFLWFTLWIRRYVQKPLQKDTQYQLIKLTCESHEHNICDTKHSYKIKIILTCLTTFIFFLIELEFC